MFGKVVAGCHASNIHEKNKKATTSCARQETASPGCGGVVVGLQGKQGYKVSGRKS
jgi:hypothetical protein